MSSCHQFSEMTNLQRAFLRFSSECLQKAPWTPAAIDAALLEAMDLTPIGKEEATEALLASIGHADSAGIGAALAALDDKAVISDLSTVTYSRRLLLEETAVPPPTAVATLIRLAPELRVITVTTELETALIDANSTARAQYLDGMGIANVDIMLKNGRRRILRVELTRFRGEGSSISDECESMREFRDELVESIHAVAPALEILVADC